MCVCVWGGGGGDSFCVHTKSMTPNWYQIVSRKGANFILKVFQKLVQKENSIKINTRVIYTIFFMNNFGF